MAKGDEARADFIPQNRVASCQAMVCDCKIKYKRSAAAGRIMMEVIAMAIRNIVYEGDEILTKVCRPVEKFDEKLAMLLDDMADTLKDADGCGLAAPQVGILRRVCIVAVGEGIIELINPVIVEKTGRQEDLEGCLSCPGDWGVTRRPKKVTVRAQDRHGKEFTVSGEDLKARALCHEIDHLDGILFRSHVIRYVKDVE